MGRRAAGATQDVGADAEAERAGGDGQQGAIAGHGQAFPSEGGQLRGSGGAAHHESEGRTGLRHRGGGDATGPDDGGEGHVALGGGPAEGAAGVVGGHERQGRHQADV
ncbi:hypothetical protein B7486_65875, partial [cyanobacterium TDX16]